MPFVPTDLYQPACLNGLFLHWLLLLSSPLVSAAATATAATAASACLGRCCYCCLVCYCYCCCYRGCFCVDQPEDLELTRDPKKDTNAHSDPGTANVPGFRVRKQTRNIVAVMRKCEGKGRYYLFLEGR